MALHASKFPLLLPLLLAVRFREVCLWCKAEGIWWKRLSYRIPCIGHQSNATMWGDRGREKKRGERKEEL
uniref:Putative secreted protein n=1 Tax=Anopheles triannulatus TaxID=58253 RepID=A0A2M4B1S3_9DIPT